MPTLGRESEYLLHIAYWAVNGPAKAKQLEREIEAAILANQKHRDESGVVTGDSAEEAKSLGLTMEQVQAAKLLGMSPAEYVAFAKVDNLESYRKFKKDKKKKVGGCRLDVWIHNPLWR